MNFRTLQMDSRKQDKYIIIFGCSVLQSLLTCICYVEELISELISQENDLTSLSQICFPLHGKQHEAFSNQ